MTNNGDIFRLLLLMLLVLNDKGEGCGVTGTLNTMMIMALLAGDGGSGNCGGNNNGVFPS